MKKETALRKRLLQWFYNDQRDLPWRKNRNPYRIWVSEIMLQQTRVETVIPYYQRFLREFPSIKALANAQEERVLKLWEGLGYYTRARNLHKAAKRIVENYQGIFPDTFDEIKSLPGIGLYTAGAIASIAFGIPAPALDGNVKRVLSRLFAVEEWIDKSTTVERFHDYLLRMISADDPGSFNESMMELGARICLPKKPLCQDCPVSTLCEANLQNRQSDFPLKKPKKKIPHYEVVAAAIHKNGKYLLGKRPDSSMLAGLWEFPGGKVEEGETHEEALAREIKEELDIDVKVNEFLVSVDHAYSHYTVTLHLYRCEHLQGKPKNLYHSEVKWIPRKQFDQYPFPSANSKFFPYVK